VHPFITESIAAEHIRDLERAAGHHRDARLARDRRLRQRPVPRTPGTVRLLPARLRPHLS
jgi:hypothetical protein